jgi:hypothetical protein
MKRNKNRLVGATSIMAFVNKRLLLLLFAKFALFGVVVAQTPQIWPVEISFNYESGSTNNDAVTITKNESTLISIPEYVKDSRNESSAYIKSQSSRKIKVKFNSNNSNMNYLVKATTISGTGIGNVCEMFIAPCDLNKVLTIELSGSIPGNVGKRTFIWKWEATALPINSPYCPITCTPVNTEHTYYTLLSAPVAPSVIPLTSILDYACTWANGKSDANSICSDILKNGFNSHYTWDGTNCSILSSDFVRLVSSLGISASIHLWWAWTPGPESYLDDMSYMRTRPIDPVGNTYSLGTREFAWHQWTEASGSQIDPSFNISLPGSWGAYETDLFTNYQKVTSVNPQTLGWVANQPGQSQGCEVYEADDPKNIHCRYSSYPSNIYLLNEWHGPDR